MQGDPIDDSKPKESNDDEDDDDKNFESSTRTQDPSMKIFHIHLRCWNSETTLSLLTLKLTTSLRRSQVFLQNLNLSSSLFPRSKLLLPENLT